MSKYGGKRHFVYLAGSISKNPGTYLWREIFADLMKYDDVVILDPCQTRFNQDLKSGADWDLKEIQFRQGRNLLQPKDYQMIKIASIMVLNLNYYTEDKPMIGSIFEFAWATRIFNIPVIVVCANQDNNPYALHPWIQQYAGAIVGHIEDAVSLIREFFL